MSTRVRFATARDVFEAFPQLRHLIPTPLDAAEPLDYTRRLAASSRPANAIAFLAFLLPRREAVWWAHECVAALLPEAKRAEGFLLADAWVRAPEEANRRRALEAGQSSDYESAADWLALAAGWSGGSVTPIDRRPALAEHSMCARAVNAAIVLACTAAGTTAYASRVAVCVEAGLRFAVGGDARVAPRAA